MADNTTKKAVFAGGCFWCMEPPFDKAKGVLSTTSGYIGGSKETAIYSQVSSGKTKHTEALEVTYDSSLISYEQLLDIFWRNIDPFVKNRQFCDVGTQYRTGIFYDNNEEKKLADATKAKIENKFNKTVHTEITKATEFYKAEEYHQDYYKKNPMSYKTYRLGCGRDRKLKKIWK